MINQTMLTLTTASYTNSKKLQNAQQSPCNAVSQPLKQAPPGRGAYGITFGTSFQRARDLAARSIPTKNPMEVAGRLLGAGSHFEALTALQDVPVGSRAQRFKNLLMETALTETRARIQQDKARKAFDAVDGQMHLQQEGIETPLQKEGNQMQNFSLTQFPDGRASFNPNNKALSLSEIFMRSARQFLADGQHADALTELCRVPSTARNKAFDSLLNAVRTAERNRRTEEDAARKTFDETIRPLARNNSR